MINNKIKESETALYSNRWKLQFNSLQWCSLLFMVIIKTYQIRLVDMQR